MSFEHRLLAEAIGNDFQPPPFFDEQPFEEVRRPCETTMRDRQAQVRDTGLEIVLETGERTGQDVGVIGAEAGRTHLATSAPGLREKACALVNHEAGDPAINPKSDLRSSSPIPQTARTLLAAGRAMSRCQLIVIGARRPNVPSSTSRSATTACPRLSTTPSPLLCAQWPRITP